MSHRLILKVTKFQLCPVKRLDTVVKNILGRAIMPPPPCQIGLNCVKLMIINNAGVTIINVNTAKTWCVLSTKMVAAVTVG